MGNLRVYVLDTCIAELDKIKNTIAQVNSDAIIEIFTSLDDLLERQARKAQAVIISIESNGIVAARKIRQANPNIDIIFLSDDNKYAEEALKLFATAYLLRPLKLNEMQKAFGNLRN